MKEIDYEKLSRPQRLAVLLVVIGPESASEMLRHFEDSEIELICRELAQIPMVTEEVRSAAILEFSPIIGRCAASEPGGFEYAQRTVQMARGDFKASAILSRVGLTPSGGSTMELVGEIAEMEGRQIFNLLKKEQPQTISFVLSILTTERAAEVLRLLPTETRTEVVERMGTIESTSLDLVAKVLRNLSRHLEHQKRGAQHHSGGVRAVADILNHLDKDSSKALLAALEEKNATLGGAIRRKMFSFEDLARLNSDDLQRVLREVDSGGLAIAMKSATEVLKEQIFSSISKRAAENLRDEISFLGPVRLRDVEQAQDGIIQVVRRLEEDGQISTDGDSDVVA